MNDTNTVRRDLKPALVFLSGELIAVPIPLDRSEVILGRALEADVRVNDTQVSRQHARIISTVDVSKNSTEYVLHDLDSRNGTFLNGRRYGRKPAAQQYAAVSVSEFYHRAPRNFPAAKLG
jgi:pSer/pThr/pTyr-binding forkhead associated (FHA) protein